MSDTDREENVQVPNTLEVRNTRGSADAPRPQSESVSESQQEPTPEFSQLAVIYGLDWGAIDLTMLQRQGTTIDVGQIQITPLSVPPPDKPKSEDLGDKLKQPRAESPLEEPVMMDAIQLLQCTICLDFAASPIFTCANAHVICGFCVKKLKNCPTCKLKTLTNNSLADKMAKEADVMMRCLKSDFGCSQILPSTKLVEHLRSCFWRDIPCYEIQGTRCIGRELFQINNFLPHLENVHKIQTDSGPKFDIAFSYPGENSKVFQWASGIVKFDEETFFNFSELIDGNFHLWFATFGDAQKAGKYQCVIEFIPPVDGPNYMLKWRNAITATLPVFPIHECPRMNRGRPMGVLFPIMTVGMLKAWTRKIAVNNWENWCFKISVDIQRKDPEMKT